MTIEHHSSTSPWRWLFERWPERLAPFGLAPLAMFPTPSFATDMRYRRFTLLPRELAQPIAFTQVGDPRVRGNRATWTYRCEQPQIEVNVAASRLVDLDVGVLQATVTSRAAQPLSLRWLNYTFELLDDHRWGVQTIGGGGKTGIHPPRSYARNRVTLIGNDYVLIETDDSAASSNTAVPIFSVWRDTDPRGRGCWFGLEWSGSWSLSADRRHGEDRIRCEAGVKINGLTIEPGESLVMPGLYVGLYGQAAEGATNSLRRYLYTHHLPDHLGQRPVPRLTYNQWDGLRDDVTMATLVPQVDRAAELGVETWCLDAGWFGPYPDTCGNWHRAAPERLPDGLEPLAQHVRAKGMDFGMWFGPERAFEGTWAVENYPEFFWPDPDGGSAYHLNLAIPDAQDWLIELISGWIERLDLRWGKWDCNLAPGGYWQAADPTGKIQFAYIAGLYRVWDELRARHPQWMIENCASGGRRIDLGTLRRSHTNWLSDSTSNPWLGRWMKLRSQLILPGSASNSAVAIRRGAGDPADVDEAVLSRFCGKLAFHGDIASLSHAATRRVRYWADQYKQIRHVLLGEFRQLSDIPQSLDEPDVVEFRSVDGSEALVAAFLAEPAPDRALADLPAPRFEARIWTDLATGRLERSRDPFQARLGERRAAIWHATS